MKYFKGSIIFTIICLIVAFLWAHFMSPGHELQALFIVVVLSVLEVGFSFDNAVVNAVKLEKMTPIWQHRFLTWGIIIAVFGMRFLFPILIVAIFSRLNLLAVISMAIQNPDSYTHYLQISHPPIITFGGCFLMMLALNYFFNYKKQVHWIKFLEKPMSLLGEVKGLNAFITLLVLSLANNYVPLLYKTDVIIAGLWGVVVYLIVEGVSSFLEKKEAIMEADDIKRNCLMNFIYLELIDASFSLDGVLGAFALSKDVFIITIGLAIGAMFVRSLTIAFVEKKTLKQYIFLEHGAHWAIATLAIIMFISSFREVNEVLTGFLGLIFIVVAFVCSIVHNKKQNV